MNQEDLQKKLKQAEMKKIAPIAIILIILATPLAANEFLLNSEEFSFSANATAVNASLENETQLGVVTDPTLEFGEVPSQAQITKSFNINSEKTALSRMGTTGNISENLEYTDKHLFQGETSIETKFNATEPGYYEGTVEMNVKTPKRTGGSTWLEIKSKLPY